jgi:hypothetical protein
LEKISREIHSTEARLVEKLVQILTPEPIVSPFPAHAVMLANPIRDKVETTPEFQFFTYKNLSSQPGKGAEQKQVFFSPAGSYLLYDSYLKYLVSKDAVYEFFENEYKEPVIESKNDNNLNTNSIWFGIQFNGNLKDLNKYTLYFDVRDISQRDDFLNKLHNAKWYANGQEVSSSRGPGIKDDDGLGIESWLDNTINLSSKIRDHVNRYYQQRFCTLDLSDLSEMTENTLPSTFRSVFDEGDLDNLDKNIIWVEARFAQSLNPRIAEDLLCFTNAFPVVNQRLNEIVSTTRDSLNIIPLSSEETFLDLHRVTNREGDEFRVKQFVGLNALEEGSILLRHSGVNRFDERSAKENLEYLIELLKDESASFSMLGSDIMSSDLKSLDQAIARLEKKVVNSALATKDTPYIIVKPAKDDSQVYIEFWSTDGPFANDIKTGNPVQLYKARNIQAGNIKLLTNTRDGKEKPGTEERINIYRKSLLSKDRIVTAQDIKATCYECFGNVVDSVEVKKGLMKGLGSNSGFIRSIDIHLALKHRDNYSDEDIYNFKSELLIKLESQSANILPYRVYIK